MILIHFWGEDSDKWIANRFMAAAASLGTMPVLLQRFPTVNKEILSFAAETRFEQRYFDLLSYFAAVLDVPDCRNVVVGCEIEPEHFQLYCSCIFRLFDKLMECRPFTQIRIPTKVNAEESSPDPEDCILRMTRTNDIDYDTLKVDCRRELERFFGIREVVIHTGTELGIGMNQNVKDLCGYTVLDEKMAGTFHIAVGANQMFGGHNQASNHNAFAGFGRMEVKTNGTQN